MATVGILTQFDPASNREFRRLVRAPKEGIKIIFSYELEASRETYPATGANQLETTSKKLEGGETDG